MKVYRATWLDRNSNTVTADYCTAQARERSAKIIRSAGVEVVFSEAERDLSLVGKK